MMKRKYIIILVAILLPVIIVATCIHYSITLKKHGYQPESIADFFWQGSQWRSDMYMVTQNVAEYPLTEDITIRCSIQKGPTERYTRDCLRVNSVLGPYYLFEGRDRSVSYTEERHDLDGSGDLVKIQVFERPDCLILIVRSDHLFVDFYGEPAFTHTYGEDYPNQFGNIVYHQYFIVPELKDLPDDYYLSGGPFTITMANFRNWQDNGWIG